MIIQEIFAELKTPSLTPNPNTPSTWTGAGYTIENAPEAIATLERAIDWMCADPAIDYDYLSKYPLIGALIEDLPDQEPGKEMLRRLLDIALEAHGRNLYFAYGSNMDLDQMSLRCPQAIVLGTTRVQGYEFLINSRGVASIRPKPGAQVEGVVFALTPECNEVLDRYEGVRWNTYTRETVRDELGLGCLVYLAADQTPTLGNDSPYLRRIIAAAERFSLSPDTIEGVRRFARDR
jgi:gamma-glutamylcyclotransferase (GGCT)/AIG2-like uncharacterized protein YtfP